ncbi:hypothetical protein BDR26DRAFT_864694 [Obelidium mucronatum]|nr:hypothetical protein BDR26DRAFT_864694 [Obelidium mucronatum]
MKYLSLLATLLASVAVAQFGPANVGEDCGGFVGIQCVAPYTCLITEPGNDQMGKCVAGTDAAALASTATASARGSAAASATGTTAAGTVAGTTAATLAQATSSPPAKLAQTSAALGLSLSLGFGALAFA